MSEKILVTLGALIFLVTGIFMFLHKSGWFNIETIPANEPENSQPVEIIDEPAGTTNTGSSEPGGLTRIDSAINTEALEVVTSEMANAPLPTDPEYWGIENDMLPGFAETLNAIFAGDEEALRETFSEQWNCGRNDYRNLEDVERGIGNVRDMAMARMSERISANPERAERWVGAMELRALDQLEDCTWRHQSAAKQLRTQVASQAQAGDVMARYVYATMLWPSPHEENYPEEHAAWAYNALKFSEQNVMESWTLGYEAMELSANWGWFTPVSKAMGQAWGIVLTTCPIAGPAPIGGDWNTRFRGMTDFSNSAPIHAARLIEQHCPDASASYTPPDIVSVEQRSRENN
jgi:hypothetical protein